MPTPKELLACLPGGRILDVATGNGNFVSFLLEGLPAFDEIVGIDTSEKAGTTFTDTFKDQPHVRFEKMDAAKMDFPKASFDIVCISNSLHHMLDPQPVLDEMKRVLKPGGHFLVAEMYRDNQTETQMTHVLMHHWWGAIDTAKGIVHNQTYTRQQLLGIVSALGLQEIAIHDLSDLGEDPKDPETIKYLTDVVDQYLQRMEGLPGEDNLRTCGLELRQRVEEVGFHSATSLLFIGKNK
jgi:ubiquinone/menaquinone biosynthesis C-methylase UbiE